MWDFVSRNRGTMIRIYALLLKVRHLRLGTFFESVRLFEKRKRGFASSQEMLSIKRAQNRIA